MNWYGVRCVFHHASLSAKNEGSLYEERITLWQADSFEEAIEKAEQEALQYAAETSSQFLEFSNAYMIYDEFIKEGSEVFSLMRGSHFPPSEYISTFYDTGREKSDDVE